MQPFYLNLSGEVGRPCQTSGGLLN